MTSTMQYALGKPSMKGLDDQPENTETEKLTLSEAQ